MFGATQEEQIHAYFEHSGNHGSQRRHLLRPTQGTFLRRYPPVQLHLLEPVPVFLQAQACVRTQATLRRHDDTPSRGNPWRSLIDIRRYSGKQQGRESGLVHFLSRPCVFCLEIIASVDSPSP